MAWLPPSLLKPEPGYWGMLLHPAMRIGYIERHSYAPLCTHYTSFRSDTDVREYIMGVFDKAFSRLNESAGQMTFVDEEFAQQYPTLYIFLTAPMDDAGKPRTVSTLMIFQEQGMCKAMLKERDHDVSLWVSSSSILGVFGAMEEALNKPHPDWRKPGPKTYRR